MMRRNTFLAAVILLTSGAAIRDDEKVAKPLTLAIKIPTTTRITGSLEFDITIQRWGPPPTSQPAGVISDGVIGDEGVRSLQVDETYQQAVANEKPSQPVVISLKANEEPLTQMMSPGIYSLNVIAFDRQSSGRGRPMVCRRLWVVSLSAKSAPLNLGTLKLPDGLHLHVGDVAPAISGTRFDGKPFDSSITKGKWYVVSFWATWCPPCLQELPDVAALKAAFPDIEIIGMCFDDLPATGKQYCEKQGYEWPNIWLGKMETSGVRSAWGIETLPQLFVIDPAGNIAAASASPRQVRTILEKR